MKEIHTKCRDTPNLDCSKKALKKINFNADKILKCVDNSFEGGDKDNSTDNSILRQESLYRKNGPFVFPALVINNQTYRGSIVPEYVFEAICKGFQHLPEECGGFQDGRFDTDGIGIFTIIIIVISVLLCNIGLLVCYRNYHRKEMQQEIRMTANTAVSQYFAVANFDKDDSLRRPNV